MAQTKGYRSSNAQSQAVDVNDKTGVFMHIQQYLRCKIRSVLHDTFMISLATIVVKVLDNVLDHNLVHLG